MKTRQRKLAYLLKQLGWLSVCFALSVFAQDEPDFALDGEAFPFSSGAYDGMVGGTVWYDEDKDGLQNSDPRLERGFDKVKVELLDDSDKVIATTYTDGSGFYLFDTVDAGNYRVRITEPDDCRLSPPNADSNNQDTLDSDFNESTGTTDVFTINSASSMNYSVDAGLICNEAPAITTTAADDEIKIDVAGAATINVLDNDILSSGVSELTIVSSDAIDTVEVVNDTLVIRDAQNPGQFTIRYRVRCIDGSSSEGVVNLNLDFPPPPPVLTARDDTVIMKVGESINFDPMENDTITSDFSRIQILSTNVPALVLFKHSGPLVIRAVTEVGNYEVEYQLTSTTGTTSRATVNVVVEPNPNNNLNPSKFIFPQVQGGCTHTITNTHDEAVDVNVVITQWSFQGIKIGSLQAGETKVFNMPSYWDTDPKVWNYITVTLPGRTNWGDWITFYSPKYCHSTLFDGKTAPPPRNVEVTTPRTIYGCVVPISRWNSTSVWITEPTTTDYADSYRTYDQWGRLMGQESNGFIGEGWLTFQWGMEGPVPYSGIPTPRLAYYVSRIVNGVESPALQCQHNPDHNTPIALDLNNDGRVSRVKGEFSFDFTGEGEPEIVSEWFGPNEGILIDARIGDHISGQHLFGDLGGRYLDGYQRLAQWDLNKDSWVQGGELSNLGLWIDTNSNAKLDKGEIKSLAEFGIIRLSTQHKGDYLSRAQLENGQSIIMEDVFFEPAFVSSNTVSASSLLAAGSNTVSQALRMTKSTPFSTLRIGWIMALLLLCVGCLMAIYLQSLTTDRQKSIIKK